MSEDKKEIVPVEEINTLVNTKKKQNLESFFDFVDADYALIRTTLSESLVTNNDVMKLLKQGIEKACDNVKDGDIQKVIKDLNYSLKSFNDIVHNVMEIGNSLMSLHSSVCKIADDFLPDNENKKTQPEQKQGGIVASRKSIMDKIAAHRKQQEQEIE